MGAKRNATIIIMSLIFAIVLVSLVNVGMAIFYDKPDYSDYCSNRAYPTNIDEKDLMCPDVCTTLWEIKDGSCIKDDCGSGCGANGITTFDTKEQCELILNGKDCQDVYNEARDKYNNLRFYIFAGIGFLIILIGLFVPEPITKFTGLGAGGIIVIEAVLLNLNNKIAVFITLLLFLIIGIFATIKLLKKQKK